MRRKGKQTPSDLLRWFRQAYPDEDKGVEAVLAEIERLAQDNPEIIDEVKVGDAESQHITARAIEMALWLVATAVSGSEPLEKRFPEATGEEIRVALTLARQQR